MDPAAIEQCEAQDALNVESNRTGTGVRKRDGYEPALTVSPTGTQVLSVVDFKAPNGNECLLAIDAAGTVYRSINSASAVAVSTFAAGERLYCSISDGFAYCFTSGNGLPFSYDCTTWTNETLQGDGYPNGKFSVFTQDRQLVAGTTDFLNRLYVGKSGDFDNFQVGINKVDAFTEDIGRNGDRITGLAFLNGRVIVFKEYSIGGFDITDQFKAEYYDIAHNVGISDPSAWVIAEGQLYFKASDNHIYVMDGAPGNVKRISKKLERTVAAMLSGKARYVILTDKTDWDAGNYTAQGALAAMTGSITPGSVEPSSVTMLDTSSVDFGSGTKVNVSTDSRTSITISSTSFEDNFSNSDLTTNPAWTFNSGEWIVTNGYLRPNANSIVKIYSATSISTGSWKMNLYMGQQSTERDIHFLATSTNPSTSSGYMLYAKRESNGNATLEVRVNTVGTVLIATTITSGWSTGDFKLIEIVRNFDGQFSLYQGGVFVGSHTDTTYTRSDYFLVNDLAQDSQASRYDDIYVFGYSSYGVTTSRIFDSGFSTPTWGAFLVSLSSSSDASATFQVQASTAGDGGGFETIVAQSLNEKIGAAARRYIRYKATFATTYSTKTASIEDVSLLTTTTGQYITSCLEPGTGITAWGTLEAAGTTSGSIASFSFANSTGTSCTDAGLGNTWTATSTGTTVSIATSAAYKARVTFSVGSASDTARIDSLTLNWTEGSVAPPSYAAFWNNYLYFSVSTGTTKNNRVLKYDPSDGSFYVFDVGMNSPISYNNNFYFGSTANGKVYRFSNIDPDSAPTSDDGANINAYWRSKSFSGGDPFAEKQLNRISLLARKQSGGTLSPIWNVNGGNTATGSYSVAMSTGHAVVNHNYNVPVGQRGIWWDYRVGNLSTLPFEVLGVRFDFSILPWRVLP